MRTRRTLLPFLPSLLFGVAGALWVVLDPPDLQPRIPTWAIPLPALLLAGLLLGGALLLERISASYRHGSTTVERALRGLQLPLWAALPLAAATAVGEELLFRGGLMQVLGVWGQALLFGALHPVSRRAWAYSLYTAFAGLLFGYAVLIGGSLWIPILAHFLVNLYGLVEVGQHRR